MQYKSTIEEMQQLALVKGGKCVSKTYMGNHAKLKWQCAKGHVWHTTPSTIKNEGSWCPECARLRRIKVTIEEMQEIAKSKGGTCLSPRLKAIKIPLRWKCAKGHTWKATPNSIKYNGSWCPKCFFSSKPKKNTLAEMQELARAKGGRFLSDEYLGINTKYRWECARKHIWWTTSSHVMNDGTWCRKCVHIDSKGTIEEMQNIAKAKGGKCLSKRYTNVNIKLSWECDKGHRWQASPSNIKSNNSWCPTCAIAQSVKHNIEEMQELAKARAGKCLSATYINLATKLQWQCVKGHTWWTTPHAIMISNSWCPKCSGKEKLTIEKMQEFARLHNGKCISPQYIDNNTPLKWQCDKGHIWEVCYRTIVYNINFCKACWRLDQGARKLNKERVKRR